MSSYDDWKTTEPVDYYPDHCLGCPCPECELEEEAIAAEEANEADFDSLIEAMEQSPIEPLPSDTDLEEMYLFYHHDINKELECVEW